jgi:signal transduction histidine kinase/CheY-like chemotaxis protein/Flp pilus assembly protein TadD
VTRFLFLVSLLVSSFCAQAQIDSLSQVAQRYAGHNLDSSRLVFEMAVAECQRTKDDTTLIKITRDYVRALRRTGEIDLGLQYLYRAKALNSAVAQLPKFQYYLCIDFFNIHYENHQNYDSALHYAKKQRTVADDSNRMALAHNRMGVIYNAMGDPVKALENYNQAMAFQQTSPKVTPLNKALVYNNLGILYEDDGDNDRAEQWYLKAVEMYKGIDSKPNEFNLWNNIAILYDHQHRYEESLATMAKAEAMLGDLGDFGSKAMVGINTGNTLVHAGRAAESIPRFKDALDNFAKEKNPYGVASCHRQLAEAYFKMGKYREGEHEAFLTIDLARKEGYDDLVREAYHDLYDIYDATKNYSMAFKYQKLYYHIQDSLRSRERRSKIGLLEKNYEMAQQEAAKSKLERENELHVIQARVDGVTRMSLISGVVVLAVVAFGFVVAYRQSRDRNRLLAEQKTKIEDQANELQEAARAKAKFFTNVSHELRTPVTLLNGMLELMQSGGNADVVKEKMDIALGSSRRLQDLVGEVLDLSRAESGKSEIIKRNVDVHPLLTRIVFAFESLFVKKNITLKYETDGLRNVFAELDSDKFEKIINNLVYNAIKFNRENGWIKITGATSNNLIVIEIADSGVGIAEKDLPHIFDRFYQGSTTNNVEGIGVGLSLVKEFVTLHGGEVSVVSKQGEGTTFTLKFPVGDASPVVAEDTVSLPDVSLSEFGKPTVLIVEDNDEMRYYLREILGNNISLAEARNGREAIRWLEKNNADLIVSDIMMPEMDGNELVKKLKASESWKRIPIVVLTARATEDDLLHFLSFGVDDYIIKPFNARELRIRIHNLLTNQALRQQWNSKPVEEEEKESIPTETDVFLGRVREFVTSNVSNPNPGIGDLADHMAMSERQLYRKCGAVAGMTPAQLIKEIKLDIAWQSLVNKKVTKITELARSLGYDNVSYFSKLFSERYGKRPTDMV